MEVWQKVLFNQEAYFETIHGRYGCITCHGGVGGAEEKEAAHDGLVRDPASAEACGDCHPDQLATDAQSLHSNLTGYITALSARSEPSKMAQLDVMMGNHCESCHTTCGQCHVSRPTSTGGGLLSGHLFKAKAAFTLTCTGCHGSRIDSEYKGKNEGVPADVHWTQGGMPCYQCHTGDEMHGAMGEFSTRYDGASTPLCTDCDPDVGSGDGIQYHTSLHLEALSCQVCHSTTYKNCYSCHVSLEGGTAYYKTEPSTMAFKIGLNPIQSEDRPWKYVPVRHVPVDPESFADYGENLLPNFDALPTWKYATPHNIQRNTPQTASCNACHGNTDLFLTEKDLLPYEVEANHGVIVSEPPAKMAGN